MKKNLSLYLTTHILLLFLFAVADGQLLDTNFRPAIGTNTGAGQIIRRSDGKFVVIGWFRVIGGVHRNLIALLNPDGTVDTSFDAGDITHEINVTDATVSYVIAQPDGKVIIFGGFTHINGVPRGTMARLNIDGSLDPTFNIGIGVNNSVSALCLQPDGKILIGGKFTTFDSQAVPPVIRLNPDGSRDQTFNAMLSVNPFSPIIEALAVQPDGKIIATGEIFSIQTGQTPRHSSAKFEWKRR